MHFLTSPFRPLNIPNRAISSKLFMAVLAGAIVASFMLAGSLANAQVNFIGTVAGGAAPSGSAASLDLPGPSAIAEDAAGNIYVASPFSYQVFKITPSGAVSVFAGVGIKGFAGEGGPATNAVLSSPSALAFDSAGDLYLADLNRVRCILAVANGCGGSTASIGSIVTVAGTGLVCSPSWGVCGDGGPAISATLDAPQGLFVDASNNLYIADTQDQRIRVVSGGNITTVAGTGHICDGPTETCGDNGAAINAKLDMPTGITLDSLGNIWVADTRDQRIRCIIQSASGCAGDKHAVGTIVTTVGTGQYCTNPQNPCGDGLAPKQAHLLNPAGISFDAAGNLYFADQSDHRIRAVTAPPNSVVTTLAGSGIQNFCGDGGAAKSACLDLPYAVLIDSKGVLWVGDTGNQRIRQVVSNNISTFAGGGSGGDGGAATAANLANPVNVAWDAAGNYYIADSANNRIRKVSGGKISTVAGSGSAGFAGDGGSALSAFLQSPGAVAVDTTGNIYFADTANFVIREVAAGTGVISTIAGTAGVQCLPSNGVCGDGGPGTAAQLVDPTSLALDSTQSNLYIADYFGNRIRVLNLASGTINTAAGTGTRGNGGDNGPATAATLNHPWGIALDNSNNLYLTDTDNNRARCVLAVANGCGGSQAQVGSIVPFAFTGNVGFAGDGNLALKAKMTAPLAMASDPGNNVYIGGGVDSVVRRIDASTQTIQTVAGNPAKPTNASFCGDNGPATKACLDNEGMSVNASLGLLIADAGNNRIRQTNMVAAVTANPLALNFPNTQVGKNSKPMSVTFTNTGAADLPLGVFSITGPDPGDFQIFGNTCTSSLAPGLKCAVSVVFTPQAQGTRNGFLKNANYPQRLPLSGVGQ